MDPIAERYDRLAEDYARYWAPVIEPTARRLVAEADRFVEEVAASGRPPEVLDVGTGTGPVALEAARRWPGARVTGADPAAGMLDVARRRATEAGLADDRITWVHADAAALPLADRSIDLALSSFVYQLVPDRSLAFREAYRVLRPGGRLDLVTWLAEDRAFRPMDEFDEAVLDLGIDEEEDPEEARSDDFPSVEAAAEELRAAGFERASARLERLEHDWTPSSYLEFKVRYDERTLFAELDAKMSRELVKRARERLALVPRADFLWRASVVFASATRTG